MKPDENIRYFTTSLHSWSIVMSLYAPDAILSIINDHGYHPDLDEIYLNDKKKRTGCDTGIVNSARHIFFCILCLMSKDLNETEKKKEFWKSSMTLGTGYYVSYEKLKPDINDFGKNQNAGTGTRFEKLIKVYGSRQCRI